jgi:hypothetical protein
MGTTRFRRHVKNWNQKYTPSPIQPCDTHNNSLKLSQAFRGLLWALQSLSFSPSPSIRGETLYPAARFPTPPLQPIHASPSHSPFHPSKHTFGGVGNKTLQDFLREVKTRTVAMWMRGYQTFTSAKRSTCLGTSFLRNDLLEHLPLLVYSSPSRCAGKLAEAMFR